MDTYRTSATAVGVLFLVALILNLVATELMNPILNDPEYLHLAYLNKSTIIIGTLLNATCALAMIFIPIVLYRVVSNEFANLASSYIVFRALEGIFFIYIGIRTLSYISLSAMHNSADSATLPVIQIIGQALQAEIQWATNMYIIIFCLGGTVFYYLLYRSKLVPRFFSVWGMLSVIILFAGGVMALFSKGIFADVPLMEGMTYFAPSIALNELILGIWLIARGFKPGVKKSSTA